MRWIIYINKKIIENKQVCRQTLDRILRLIEGPEARGHEKVCLRIVSKEVGSSDTGSDARNTLVDTT